MEWCDVAVFETSLHQNISFFHPFQRGETTATFGGGILSSVTLCFACTDFVGHRTLENVEPMLEELHAMSQYRESIDSRTG